ncbi:hypothetical protein AB4Z54_10240 [Streptomyces sp. MCAF7]
MFFFADDTDNRPPSILLATLAGRAYRGEDDLFTAVRNVLAAIPHFIKKSDGQWRVPNHAHEEENFTDKWNEYPERREAFRAWYDEISAIMDNLALTESKGLDVVYSKLIKFFDPGPVMRSFARYGARMKAPADQRMGATGLLSATATGPRRRPTTYYGQHPGARG